MKKPTILSLAFLVLPLLFIKTAVAQQAASPTEAASNSSQRTSDPSNQEKAKNMKAKQHTHQTREMRRDVRQNNRRSTAVKASAAHAAK